MAFRIYKGNEASRSYENEFFREFATELKILFDKKGIDGILIGHPIFKNNKAFQPDVVLVTCHCIMIVDFKNYGGRVSLPENFETPWFFNDTEKTISSGSSVNQNPFVQLRKQSQRFQPFLKEIKGFNDGFWISTGVVFQHEMEILGEIPGKYQRSFFVTDKNGFLNRILDFVNIRDKSIDLSENGFDEVLNLFTDFSEFTDFKSISGEIDSLKIETERKFNEIHKKLEIKMTVENKNSEIDSLKNRSRETELEMERLKNQMELQKRDSQIANLKLEKQMLSQRKNEEKPKSPIWAIIVCLVVLAGMAVGAVWYLGGEEEGKTTTQPGGEETTTDTIKNGENKTDSIIKPPHKENELQDTVLPPPPPPEYPLVIKIPTISVGDVPYYVGKEVIVRYKVGSVNKYESKSKKQKKQKKYIYLNDKTRKFYAFVDCEKTKLTLTSAKTKYLNKEIEVKGEIEIYNNNYQIKVFENEQIKIRK